MSLSQNLAVAKAHVRASRKAFRYSLPARVFLLREHKVAYLPLPKVANSSIKYALMPLVGKDPQCISRIHKFSKYYETTWEKAQEIIDAEWFVFCVVRNPRQRLQSAYVEKVVEKECELPEFRQMGLTPDTQFKDFVKIVHYWPLCELDQHLMPQTSLLASATGESQVRYFRLENLVHEWRVISEEVYKRTGVRLAEPQPVNESGSKVAKPELTDPELLRRIYKKYNRDFSFFGYS